MRRLFLLAWLLVPVAAGAYHFGPGQDRLLTDDVAHYIDEGRHAATVARDLAAREGDEAARSTWVDADEAFSKAIAMLPAERKNEARTLRIERAKAQVYIGKLHEARQELENVVDELVIDAGADPKELTNARDALANAQYYRTWLMRLEGAPREEWEPEIEASRQNYKLLAQSAGDDVEAARVARENLESAIRLERMSLADLQGLPLPSQ